MALSTRSKRVTNVSAQREAVQALIRTAQGTEAALIAAEASLDVLADATAAYGTK